MKYQEIFKKWWFWLIVFISVIINIIGDTKIYGRPLLFAECIGIFIGSLLFILFTYTILFFLIKLCSKTKKVILRK